MNIAIVVQRELNPIIGGIERVSNDLAYQWMSMGHRVVAVCLRCEKQVPFSSDISHYYLPLADKIHDFSNSDFFEAVLIQNNINIILNQNAMDLEFSEWCISVGKKRGIKVVSALHHDVYHLAAVASSGFFIVEKMGTSPLSWMKEFVLYARFWLYRRQLLIKKAQRVQKHIGKLSDALVFLSAHSVQSASKWMSADKLHYIPNGIKILEDVGSFWMKKKQVICVGRLEYGQKRIDRFIRIWASIEKEHPDWSAAIVGDGPYRFLYEKLARSLGCVNLEFTGFQNPEPFYKEAAILCMTSSTEGFGMVLVEAMQHGCVPILFDSFPAASEIVDDGVNGILVKAFDKKDFAVKLTLLMKRQSLREEMGRAARKKAQTYDIRLISQKWIKLFTKLMNGK